MGWLFGGMSVVYAHIAGLYQFRYTWGVSEWTVKLSEEVADWYQSLNQKDLGNRRTTNVKKSTAPEPHWQGGNHEDTGRSPRRSH